MGLLVLAACQSPELTPASGQGAANPLDLGRVVLGERVVMPLQLTNIGQGQLTFLDAPEVLGAAAGDFSLAAAPPANLQPQASEQLAITFAPAGSGPRTAQLSFATSSQSSPLLEVAVRGTGVDPSSLQVTLSPAVLDLGGVPIALQSQLGVFVFNAGTDAAPLQPPALVGTGAADFTVTDTDGGTPTLAPLPAGATLQLDVSFRPHGVGPSSATLVLAPCGRCAPLSVALDGIGLQAALSFDPPALDFGWVRRGQTGQALTQLSNGGNAALQISALRLASAGPFLVALADGGPLPIELPSGESVALVVTYAPGATVPIGEVDHGVIVAQALLQDAPQPPATLPVSGQAATDCRLSAAPPLLDFGRVPADGGARSQVALLNAGSDACTLEGLTITAGLDAGFSLPGRVLSVPAYGSSNLDVQFRPGTLLPSARAGQLTIEAQEAGQLQPPVVVDLRGRARRPNNPAGSAWPQFAAGNSNSNLSTIDTSRTAGFVLWRTFLGHGTQGDGGVASGYWDLTPALGADDTIYALDGRGTFWAIDPTDGFQLWGAPLVPGGLTSAIFPGLSPLVAADGTVLVQVPELFGPAPAQLSEVSPTGLIQSEIALPGATLQNVYRPLDGSAILGLAAPGGAPGAVLLDENIAQPSVRWQTPLVAAGSAALAPDGTLYLGNLQQLSDGGQGWSIPGPLTAPGCAVSAVGPQVTLTAAGLIALGAEGELLALDAPSGRLLWASCEAHALNGGPSSVSVLPSGGLVTFFGDGGLLGLERIDPPGLVRWQYLNSHLGPLLPAVGADGTIYVTAQSGPQVVAIDAELGVTKWLLTVPDAGPASSGLAIDSEGTLYFIDTSGYLDAVR